MAPGIPVLVKGLLNVNDVAKAVAAGADGVVLSNHGVSAASKFTSLATDGILYRVANWTIAYGDDASSRYWLTSLGYTAAAHRCPGSSAAGTPRPAEKD